MEALNRPKGTARQRRLTRTQRIQRRRRFRRWLATPEGEAFMQTALDIAAQNYHEVFLDWEPAFQAWGG